MSTCITENHLTVPEINTLKICQFSPGGEKKQTNSHKHRDLYNPRINNKSMGGREGASGVNHTSNVHLGS